MHFWAHPVLPHLLTCERSWMFQTRALSGCSLSLWSASTYREQMVHVHVYTVDVLFKCHSMIISFSRWRTIRNCLCSISLHIVTQNRKICLRGMCLPIENASQRAGCSATALIGEQMQGLQIWREQFLKEWVQLHNTSLLLKDGQSLRTCT